MAEEVLGDLDERFYHRTSNQSTRRAKLDYWMQVFNYLRPFALRNFIPKHLLPNLMLKHNLTLTFRNFGRHKSTFLINLIGLSTSLVCAMMIYLWVNDEVSVDKYHQHADRFYQIMEWKELSAGVFVTGSTPGILAETMADEYAEVEYAAVATPASWYSGVTLFVGDKGVKTSGKYVGKDFFEIFTYPILLGNKEHLLDQKHHIVVSESVAKNLFGDAQSAIGKTIEYQREKEFTVSGVFEDIPRNSSEQFDFVLSSEEFKDVNPNAFKWENSGPMTFLLLKEGVDIEAFKAKIAPMLKGKTTEDHRQLIARRYVDAYLYGGYVNGVQSGGRIDYVQFFSLIGILILIIAAINFTNLSTARASRRVKEIGVKKVVGANRRALVFQYLSESIILTFMAAILALLIVWLLLPQFNQITDKQLILHLDTNILVALLLMILSTGVVAGGYPAFYLSGLNPIKVFKSNLFSGRTNFKELFTRKGLVVFQFTLSITLIVAVAVVYKQLEFVQNRDIGYDREHVIHFPREGRTMENLDVFLQELGKVPGVKAATSMGQSMVGGGNTTDMDWKGKDPNSRVHLAIRPVNFGAVEMLGIKIKEGRSFSQDYSLDSASVIFNQTAIDIMGLEDPIGETVGRGEFQFKIIGIMEDFHFQSLQSEVGPLFFCLAPQYTERVVVKLESNATRETIARLEKFYSDYNPGFVFDYTFMDEEYDRLYAAENRVASLGKYFAGVAILISCLGLFGLAAFTAERRVKEIGIRKILGASYFRIIGLLTRDFTGMVLIAILVALPLSYWITSSWLSDFAYKITLEWWFFAGAGVTALLVASLTVGFQTARAAAANPVDCLKDE